MLVSDLLPRHILLTRLVHGLFPHVTAPSAELAQRGVRRHIAELCRAVHLLPFGDVIMVTAVLLLI